VGYKANVAGKNLEMSLGYSHPIKMEIPEGLTVKVEKTNVIVSGADRAQVGQFSAQIRSWREPEPYLGKGIRYSDEVIRRKAGKSGGEK
jgi:large subunit ribosomal protein L6